MLRPFPPLRRAGHHGGWKWLLPATPAARILCVTRRAGTALALAGLCERLELIGDDETPPWLEGDLAVRGTELRTATSLAEAGQADAIVVDGLAGLPSALADSRGRDGRPAVALLRALAGRLAPEGSLFLLMPNAWSHRWGEYAALPGARGVMARGGGSLQRRLRAAGLTPGRPWPLRVHEGRVHEVLVGPVRDAAGGSLRNAARRLALGSTGRRWLAPAYAVAAGRRPPGPTRLDALLETLERRGAIACASGVTALRVMPSKLVVSLDQPGGGRVLMLPDDPTESERRRREESLLAEVAHRVPEIAELLPLGREAGEFEGLPYLLVDRFEGECVDDPVPELEILTDVAVDFLCTLHGATRRPCTLDAAAYGRRFGVLFEQAAQRHPAAREFLRRLDSDVRELVVGRVLPLVVAHGDFKIENLVFERRTATLRGVIDWELAERDGLPLLDLLYLLLYNRTLHGESLAHAYREVLLHEEWQPHELRRIRRYLRAVPLGPPLVAALEAMVLVHAAARRLRFDMRDARERRELLEMLAFATARVGRALMQTRPATGTEG